MRFRFPGSLVGTVLISLLMLPATAHALTTPCSANIFEAEAIFDLEESVSTAELRVYNSSGTLLTATPTNGGSPSPSSPSSSGVRHRGTRRMAPVTSVSGLRG